jgi:hypothetical protein
MDDDSDMYHGAALQLIGVTSPHGFWLYLYWLERRKRTEE